MTEHQDNFAKRLRAIVAQQRELLRKWDEADFRLRSRKAGEPERDITEETKAEMRRLMSEYDALAAKVEAGSGA